MIVRQLVNHVIRDVRIAMDQNSDSSPLVGFGDADTLTLNELIRDHFPDAARIVEQLAPLRLLDSGNNVGGTPSCAISDTPVIDPVKLNGTVKLPADFLRLVIFQMDDWARPVFRVINEESGKYDQQYSRAAGVRGTPDRPVCAITLRPTGHVLEFWSCKSVNAKIKHGVYVPIPKWDESDGIYLCESCYRPAVYYAAGMVQQALGRGNEAAALFETAKALLK